MQNISYRKNASMEHQHSDLTIGEKLYTLFNSTYVETNESVKSS